MTTRHRPTRRARLRVRIAGAWQWAARGVAGLFDALPFAITARDILLTAGLAMVFAGLWEWSRPAALVVTGGILVWFALPPRQPFIDQPPKHPSVRRPGS